MRNVRDATILEIDGVIHERLAVAGPFDPMQFHLQALRDGFALTERWRSALRADAAMPRPGRTGGAVSLRDVGRRYRDGSLSPEAHVRECLAAIAQRNPALACYPKQRSPMRARRRGSLRPESIAVRFMASPTPLLT